MFKLPRESLEKRAKRLAAHFKIIIPDGDGPFPAIIMLHGCGRADVPQMPYANEAKKNGFVSIIVDSFAPRTIGEIEAATTVCTAIQLRGPERTGDLAATLYWALQQDYIDKNAIHAIGWSHGAWTIMDAVARENDIAYLADLSFEWPDMLANLKSIFCIYPWCGPGSNSHSKGWKRNIPTHIIACGRDMVVGDALTHQTYDKLKRDNIDISITNFKDGTHSFDEFESIHPAHKHDAGLTKQAVDLAVNFFKSHTKSKSNA